MPEAVHPDDVDSGAVLPLSLNLVETRVFLLAMRMLSHADNAIRHDAGRSHPEDVARADQVVAAAREREPIVRSLMTALEEHRSALERSMDEDDEAAP